ncbi:MAG: hypothetical protein AB1295_04185 [Candidatus Micrarchaeota archaeon]
MDRTILLIVAMALFTAGCTGEKPIGGDMDEHGCLISAGYSWCEEKQRCLRTWEEQCGQDASVFDFQSCAEASGAVMESYPRQCAYGGQTYTEETCSSGGDILTLGDAIGIAKASGCGDRLDIRCVCPEGYDKNGGSCDPSCYKSVPPCLAPSMRCQPTYLCNEITGTYWLGTTIEKEGCMPACVVFLENRSAEINWRCMGALPG